ncbi:MAG: DUF2281 domain-containing protein [Cyanobacteria bacterium]|nr:DUF2281 domain-containing protein [Cyanobacteria bacterium CG_2015-16_32_12]NCO76802.1 DUF2281 domain-containing protein [Cyanobacteria bacterium CG_2015-22_32_23]NCQ04006.1 DUF2281 domain-containing protein [Cyanobacteria bacterium CG_2015-09_32_10]NCQ40975.1 DUF2281 domain-containing protein [Cyanobacteria bacterium CG_2015-04_32_10]NCS85439.1 DUF2281 domain-containing protein [Cyanobacteria bacterium CG_2015-02_32_10]
MELKTRIWETVEKMPVSLQAELLHYAEYLQEKYHQENLTQDKSLIKSHMDKLKDTCDESLKDIDEEDFFSLAGLWQDRETSIESIRKQAWLDRNK